MKRSKLFWICMALAMMPALAVAAQKVQSPYVEQGEWSLEHYGAYGWEHEDRNDAYQYKSKSLVGYGITGWWKIELEAVLEDEADGKPLFYDATELVNKFQFWEKGEMPFDMGLYTAYEKQRDDNKADVVEAIFILSKGYDASHHTFNLILEQPVSSRREDGTEWGLAWSSMWEMECDWRLGFEYYAEFGEFSDRQGYNDQDHRIGPVAEFDLPGTEWEMKFGYLAGISRSAFDSTVKWEMEWEF